MDWYRTNAEKLWFISLLCLRNWDGKLVKNGILTVQKKSWMICFDGHPIVNDKKISTLDYAQIYPDKDYEINLNKGVLAVFTKN